MTRPRRRIFYAILVIACAVVFILALGGGESRHPDGRVPKSVARSVALASFAATCAGLLWAERFLRRRREDEAAEAVLREEFERCERSDAD